MIRSGNEIKTNTQKRCAGHKIAYLLYVVKINSNKNVLHGNSNFDEVKRSIRLTTKYHWSTGDEFQPRIKIMKYSRNEF